LIKEFNIKIFTEGWWMYDERTNDEIEENYQKAPNGKFQISIAGYLYLIDFKKGCQLRVDDETKRRRIKRDSVDEKLVKGMAGLRL
jgi:hypothetical protein